MFHHTKYKRQWSIMRRCALLLLLSKKDVKIHFENNAVFHESVNNLQFTSHTTIVPNSLLSNNTSIFTYALKFVQLGIHLVCGIHFYKTSNLEKYRHFLFESKKYQLNPAKAWHMQKSAFFQQMTFQITKLITRQ